MSDQTIKELAAAFTVEATAVCDTIRRKLIASITTVKEGARK